MLGGDVLVLEGLGFLLGLVHDRPQGRGEGCLSALRFGFSGQDALQVGAQAVPVDADLGQDRADDILLLGQEAP